jgi:hypothetical protein
MQRVRTPMNKGLCKLGKISIAKQRPPLACGWTGFASKNVNIFLINNE